MIHIHSRHDRHHREMVHTVVDGGQEVAVVRVPEDADYATVADEFGKGKMAVAMVAAFTAEEG